MNIEITTDRQQNRTAIIAVTGRLTAATAPELKSEATRLVSEGFTRLVFDLTAVAFLDSSGLAVFVSALKSTRETGGTIKLAGMNTNVGSIFRITRLDRVFDIYETAADALAALGDRTDNG
jgi:anti-sigma B factor antagonist